MDIWHLMSTTALSMTLHGLFTFPAKLPVVFALYEALYAFIPYLLIDSVKCLHLLQLSVKSCANVLHQLPPLLTASHLTGASSSGLQLLQRLLQLLHTLRGLLTQLGQLHECTLVTATAT